MTFLLLLFILCNRFFRIFTLFLGESSSPPSRMSIHMQFAPLPPQCLTGCVRRLYTDLFWFYSGNHDFE